MPKKQTDQTSTPRQIHRYIRLLRLWKRVLHRVAPYRQPPRRLVLIVGAARSGTSLMVRIFERDLRTSVFSEGSRAITDPGERGRRPLKPLPALQAVVNQTRTSMVVMKPLADMHNLPLLLETFPGAKAVWMVRHYKDVARSNLAKWGQTNGVRNLREFVENRAGTWQPSMLPESVRLTILDHYRPEMNPYDAAALVWLIRNGLFFGLQLDQDPNVAVCRYEQLIRTPVAEMERLYAFLSHAFPGGHIVREIHATAAGKGVSIALSEAVERQCHEMLVRLDQSACLGNAADQGRIAEGLA